MIKYFLAASLTLTGCTAVKTFLATPCTDVLKTEMHAMEDQGFVPFNYMQVDGVDVYVWANQATLTIAGLALVSPKSSEYTLRTFELPNEKEHDSCKDSGDLVRVISFQQQLEAN